MPIYMHYFYYVAGHKSSVFSRYKRRFYEDYKYYYRATI